MTIDVAEFLQTLPIMLKGMAGIYIVTAVIVVMMVLLVRLAADRGGKGEGDNEEIVAIAVKKCRKQDACSGFGQAFCDSTAVYREAARNCSWIGTVENGRFWKIYEKMRPTKDKFCICQQKIFGKGLARRQNL